MHRILFGAARLSSNALRRHARHHTPLIVADDAGRLPCLNTAVVTSAHSRISLNAADAHLQLRIAYYRSVRCSKASSWQYGGVKAARRNADCSNSARLVVARRRARFAAKIARVSA